MEGVMNRSRILKRGTIWPRIDPLLGGERFNRWPKTEKKRRKQTIFHMGRPLQQTTDVWEAHSNNWITTETNFSTNNVSG